MIICETETELVEKRFGKDYVSQNLLLSLLDIYKEDNNPFDDRALLERL